MTRVLDLSDTDLAIVRDILRAHLPAGTSAFVFGSRANGTSRQYSDLDLALEGQTPLAWDVMGPITEALSESDLPFKVDVIDLRATEARFRALIQADLVALAF